MKDLMIGEIVSMLRKNKNMTLKETTNSQFSESQLARFEKGETELTISKFHLILDNLNIFLDEFQSISHNWSGKPHGHFRAELAQAYATKDSKRLKTLLDTCWQQTQTEPSKKSHRLNYLVVRCILASAQQSAVIKEDILELTDYLRSVDEWGRYEIWIFGNCLHFFDKKMLDYYGQYILGRTNFYQSIHLNKQMVIRTILNIINTLLSRSEPVKALKYIQHLENMVIPIDFFYEKILLKYHKARYSYLSGNIASKKDMIACAETIETYGFREEAALLYHEINQL